MPECSARRERQSPVFGISSIFPIVAGFVKDTAGWRMSGSLTLDRHESPKPLATCKRVTGQDRQPRVGGNSTNILGEFMFVAQDQPVSFVPPNFEGQL